MKKMYTTNLNKISMKCLGVFFSFALFLLTSCKKTDYLDVDASDRSPLSAKISFVNARPVDQPLNFWTYTTQVNPTPVPMNGATPYLDAQFGLVQINITAAGSSSYLASRVFGGAATFSSSGGPNGPIAGYHHTVIAARARAKNYTTDSLILFYDDLSAPPAGKAKLRFVNLAAKSEPVDVIMGGKTVFSNVDYGYAGGAVLSGKELNAFSIGPFTTLDAGTSGMEVKTTSTGTPITLKAGNLDFTLQEGKIYSVVMSGELGNAVVASVLQHN